MTSTGSANRARPDKVTAIAVWFIINAIIPFLGAAAILIFALPAVIRGSMGNPNGYLGIIGVSFGLLLVAGLCALNVAAAVGLLQLREWARWVAIALAALGLPLIPVHTVVGGLIIWYLLTDEAKQAFGTALPQPTPQESITAAQSDNP